MLFWIRVVAIRDVQTCWQYAVNNLQARIDRKNSPLLQAAILSLSYTPWLEDVPLNGVVSVQKLSAFLTTEWLADEHELLMLDLLKKDLEEENQGYIFVENTAFSLLLKAAMADQQNYPKNKHYEWLREKGEALANGEKTHLATIVNIDGSHWVSVVINSKNKQIYYGDSFRRTIPNDLKKVFNWWLGYHMSNTPFSYEPLPVSTQSDTFSCGILCWDGLRSFLLNSKPGLINPTQALDERVRIFLRLVKPFHKPEVRKRLSIKDFFSLLTFIQESNWPELEDDNNKTHPQDGQDLDIKMSIAAPPHPSSTNICKRTHHEDTVNISSSPTMKKARLHVQSSIRKAIEEGEPRGLLLYFKKATEEEHQAYIDRTTADVKENAENEQWNKDQHERILQVKKRLRARERKRKQRMREMKKEIASGLRSPGGTKIKVSITA